MKPSGVGGQAVIEGVMMKNKSEYAIAVRKPNGDIEVAKDIYLGLNDKFAIFRLPFFRGIASFIDSLSLGMKALSYSSMVYDEDGNGTDSKRERLISRAAATEEFDIEFVEDAEDESSMGKKLVVREWHAPDEAADSSRAGDGRNTGTIIKNGIDYNKDKGSRKESVAMALTMILSFILAIGIFVVLPFVLAELLKNSVTSYGVRSLIEGAIRLVLFILYVKAITLIQDIRRVFMYHGAEHKVINCIEKGHKLNVNNAKKMPKAHKRCGTSFLLYVVLISIVLFVFIQVDQLWLRMLLRIILVPVIAGIAYEFIRLAGRSNNIILNILSIPGLWLQGLTTKEPDEEMLEVAIASVESVFDWEEYQESGRRYDFRRNRIKSIDIEEDEDDSTTVEEDIITVRSRRYRAPELAADERTDRHDEKADEAGEMVSVSDMNDGNVAEDVSDEAVEEISDGAGAGAADTSSDVSFEEETDEILAALDRYFVMDDDKEDDEEDDDKS